MDKLSFIKEALEYDLECWKKAKEENKVDRLILNSIEELLRV